MSKDYLESVLSKIAEVTNVLVETAKVKEHLENAVDDNDLKTLLERTKVQVEFLLEKSLGIKEFFFGQYDDVLSALNSINNVNKEKDTPASAPEDPLLEPTPDTVETNSVCASEETQTSEKPSIKLVDINKLVEPKSIIKKEVSREKKTVQFDDTIIITSSDDEKSSSRYRKSRFESARNDLKSKRKLPLHRDSISKVFNSKLSNTKVKTKSNTISDSDSSDSSSDSDSSFTKPLRHKQPADISTPTKDSDSDSNSVSIPIENDNKLKKQCTVNLLKIPCEKLKDFYVEQKEEIEIERLTDLSALKKKRVRNDKESSKKDTSGSVKKSNDDQQNSDCSMNSISDTENTAESVEYNAQNHSPSPTDQQQEEERAEIALEELINSDKEEEEGPAEKENQPEMEKEKSEKNSSTEKATSENEQDTIVAIGADQDESDMDNMKIESSDDDDSEEDMNTFRKKSNQIKTDMHSNASNSHTKSKRMLKRKKKAVISDSDSDKKGNDSDFKENSSKSDSSQSEQENEDKKPPRKRVKRVAESSDEEGADKTTSSTRKQIRRVWGRDSLAESTKKAEAEEKERKARIAEKQKKYNQIYDGNLQLNATVDKVVLDFDEKSKTPLLQVHEFLTKKLKPHQASGIQFMWDACFESLERAKTSKGSGCILAHCMGLGKTLQVIALSHTLLMNRDKTNVKAIMVVSPLNTILNWKNEFIKWQKDFDKNQRVLVYELISSKQNKQRQDTLLQWRHTGGVLIIGYNMFRNLSNFENKRISKKFRMVFKETLVDPGPDMVVCDEGHLLKNEKTNISVAMNRLKTLKRIVLTGTPLQNNLKEYFCMVQFIKPSLLGTYKEYLNRFVNPIINGQYTDSTLHDIQIMRKRSHVLHKMLDGVVQRRDYSVLQPYLPPKHEYVLFLNLTETQIKLYQHYMDHYGKQVSEGRTSFIFADFQALQRICTHPRVLLDKSIDQRLKEKDMSDEDSAGSLKDFIDDDDDDDLSSKSSASSGSDDENAKSSSPVKTRYTRSAAAAGIEDEALPEPEQEKEWWQQYCDGPALNNIELSSKIFLLFEILKECDQIGDKILVFSQSLYSLNVIEHFLGLVHDATEAGDSDSVCGYTGSWCLGLDYFRLDGSSSCDNRTIWCDSFNNPTNTRARLFLISTKAGGLGINLVAANRVIIFDVSWNPSHDVQSIYRVYRFGQTKPSYIYRFVTYGTMEMKIYERQVTKQAISKRVIDEQQIDRHYNQNDLQELYKFDPNPGSRPIPLVPKDVLLGELIHKFEDRIYKYHEHQSLLENKEEEGLNEDERKAAWEEFENEKKQRPQYGSGTPRMDPNLSTALINIIMRENPTFTPMEVKNVLPALFMQLQQQMAKGDLSFYAKVQQELRILQAMQNQRLKEQFYQAQAMKLLQEQQRMALNNPRFNNAQFLEMLRQMPGPSGQGGAAASFNPNEIIELND